jgi:shikimate kinase
MDTSPLSRDRSRDSHIVLVGMMGAGKSTVGERLAGRLGRPFFDVDTWIEDEEGLSVAAIFERLGEGGFRDIEARVLPSFLASPTACVLSVGGGAVIDPKNRRALGDGELVVWLRARPDTLVDRVGDGSDRPLLRGEDLGDALSRLAQQRAPLYTEVADVVVDVDDLELDEVVDRIVGSLA